MFGSKELGQNVWGNLILFVLDNGTPSFSLLFGGCEKRSCHSFRCSFRENEACQLPCFSLSHTEFPVRILIPNQKTDLLVQQQRKPTPANQVLIPGSPTHMRKTFSRKISEETERKPDRKGNRLSREQRRV